MSFKKESALYDPIAVFKRQRSFRLQQGEVQFYEYRIDFFGFSEALNLTVAIELKLRDWRRAIEQAILYQLCSDLVYIAVPSKTASRVDTAILLEHGIGLIGIKDDGECEILVDASQSTVVRDHYRNSYIHILKRAG